MEIVGGPYSGNASSVVWLDQIPRTSPGTMSSYNFNVGDKVTIYTNRKSSIFTHNIYVYFGGFEKQLASGVTDSWEWDTNNNIDELLLQMTTVNSLWGRIRVQTMNGNTWIGDVDLGFTLNVTDANPEFNNFVFEDIGSKTVPLTGDNKILVKGYSIVKATISTANKAIAKKKATMTKYRLQIGTEQYEENYSDTEDVVIETYGVKSNVLNMYAIDSRGNSTLKTLTPSDFKNYEPPIIKNVELNRSDGGVGSGVILKFDGYIWNENFGVEQNEITECLYYYKKTGEDNWIQGSSQIIPTVEGNSFSGTFNIEGDLDADGFDPKYSYSIWIRVFDKLFRDNGSGLIGTGIPTMAVSPNKGVSFGAPYNESLGGFLQKEDATVFGAKVLYENQSGTTGTVTLSETVENFKKIEIFYGKSFTTLQSVDVENANGKQATLITGYFESVNMAQIQLPRVAINGNSISKVNEGLMNFNENEVHLYTTNEVSIYKVLGYM